MAPIIATTAAIFLHGQCSYQQIAQDQLKAMWRAIAVVDGVKPRDETEALLACQMAASHALAMQCLLRTRHTDSLQRFEANGNMATKFLRTFAVQMETLARVRRGGKQKVVVEHVHVHAGGNAAVGTFVQQQPGGGVSLKSKVKPMQSPDPTLSPSSQGRCGEDPAIRHLRLCRSTEVIELQNKCAPATAVSFTRREERKHPRSEARNQAQSDQSFTQGQA